MEGLDFAVLAHKLLKKHPFFTVSVLVQVS